MPALPNDVQAQAPLRWLDTFGLRLLGGWCLLLVLIWASLGYDYSRLRQLRMEKARAQALGVAQSMEERVVRTIRTVEVLLGVAEKAIHRRAPQADMATVGQILRGLDPQFEELLTISFVDRQGETVFHSNPQIPVGADNSPRDFFQIHSTQAGYGTYISNPFVGSVTGKRVFLISKRLSDPRGGFLGVLVATVSTDALAAQFNVQRIGERGTLILMHIPSRTILLRQPDYEATFGKSIESKDLFQALQKAPSGHWEGAGMVDQEPRQFTYRRLADYPLLLNVGVAMSDIEAHLHEDLLSSWIVVVVLTLATGGACLAILVEHRRQLHNRRAWQWSARQMQAVIDATPGCVKRLSADGVVLGMNAAGLAMLEAQDSASVLGRSYYSWIAPLHQEAFRRFNEQVCSGQAGALEYEVLGLQGTRRWMATRAVPFAQPGSGRWEHLAVTLDITEKKQAEEAQRLAASVFRHSGEAMMVTDAQRTVLSVNPAFERITGFSEAELLGRRARIYRGPHFDANFDQAVWQQLQDVGSWNGEAQGRRKSGETYPQWMDIAVVKDSQGAVMRYIALHSDMSERKQSALALQRLNDTVAQSRQRLRELAVQYDAAREEERKHVAREVHDELGQTLTALRLEISMLGLGKGAEDQPLQAKIKSMKALVDRAIAGVRNVTTHLRPTALELGLESAIEWLCEDFSARSQIPCHLHLESGGVELDEARCVVVFRIVQESLTNVLRYAQASEVNIQVTCVRDQLVVQVQDNGRGFDTTDLVGKKTFGMLGMRERALTLGGSVQVRSESAGGCIVTLSIPLDVNNVESPQ